MVSCFTRGALYNTESVVSYAAPTLARFRTGGSRFASQKNKSFKRKRLKIRRARACRLRRRRRSRASPCRPARDRRPCLPRDPCRRGRRGRRPGRSARRERPPVRRLLVAPHLGEEHRRAADFERRGGAARPVLGDDVRDRLCVLEAQTPAGVAHLEVDELGRVEAGERLGQVLAPHALGDVRAEREPQQQPRRERGFVGAGFVGDIRIRRRRIRRRTRRVLRFLLFADFGRGFRLLGRFLGGGVRGSLLHPVLFLLLQVRLLHHHREPRAVVLGAVSALTSFSHAAASASSTKTLPLKSLLVMWRRRRTERTVAC